MSKKVLVVQDNQALQREIAAMLGQAAYEVLAASDGEEGWATFVEHEPSAVISAVRMPNVDGLSLLRRIKNKTPECKVVLVSGSADAQQEALSLGAAGFLLAPIQDSGELIRLIES